MLAEIAQRLALRSGLLCVKAEMIGITKLPLEQHPSLVQFFRDVLTCAGYRFDELEGAHIESAFFAGEAIDPGVRRIAVHDKH